MNFDIYLGDEKLRFLLGYSGRKPCFIVGVNPSTATPKYLDQTIKKVWRFIELDVERGEESDSFIMLNLYPFRSKNPKSLPTSVNAEHKKQNQDEICRVLGKVKDPIIWAAWGNTIEYRSYLFECLEEIANIAKPFGAKWKHRGDLTQADNPRHPSRLSFEHRLNQFDIEYYLRCKRSG
jgi:hypothetical protein